MNITHELRRALQVNSCATTAADAARGVSGQVLGTRMSEIYLFRSPRPSNCHDAMLSRRELFGAPEIRPQQMHLSVCDALMTNDLF